jgi:hypothetical protein
LLLTLAGPHFVEASRADLFEVDNHKTTSSFRVTDSGADALLLVTLAGLPADALDAGGNIPARLVHIVAGEKRCDVLGIYKWKGVKDWGENEKRTYHQLVFCVPRTARSFVLHAEGLRSISFSVKDKVYIRSGISSPDVEQTYRRAE